MPDIRTISTFFKEENGGRTRAEVIRVDNVYSINYYDAAGEFLMSESYPGKTLGYVEDAAENWAEGIKVLTE